MIVFKNYFKIAKSYIPSILMFVGISFGIALIVSTNTTEMTSGFTASKPYIAVINRDEKNTLLNHFESYIEGYAEIVSLEDDEEKLKDALFFRTVHMILIIPDNYTNDFLEGKDPQIEILKIPDSGAIYSEMIINRYLNIANIYAFSGMNQEDITKNISSDLEKQANIKTSEEEKSSEILNASALYNFFNYTFLSVCILVVATIMSTFKKETVRKRNLSSSLPYRNQNTQLFLGNLCFVIALWILCSLASIILFPEAMLNLNGLLLIINLFVFSITALAFGFLIGNFVRNTEAISGISNVVGLGTSFISGAFVPQSMLGGFVLNMSMIFPSYWYIKNNDAIVLLSNFDFNTLKPILINTLIVVSFGILFFLLTNIISRITLKKQ